MCFVICISNQFEKEPDSSGLEPVADRCSYLVSFGECSIPIIRACYSRGLCNVLGSPLDSKNCRAVSTYVTISVRNDVWLCWNNEILYLKFG